MTTILKPISGKDIPDSASKGSVYIVSDESVIKLTPTIYNNIPNCITFELQSLEGCCDIGPKSSKRWVKELLDEFEDECSDSQPLTAPMCHRSPKSAWQAAADILLAAAEACQAQADKASGDLRV